MPLALTAGLATFAVASPAMAAPATIDWQGGSNTTSAINAGEAVTWNVVEGGHNVDVISGPETFQSTSGKDPKGTQFSHVFNTPGTYKFICDYHSSMKGTITVASVQSQPAGGGSAGGSGSGSGTSPQPAAGGSGAQPTTGAPAGPAGEAAANGVDAAAPTVNRVSLNRSTLKVRLSEPAKLTIRYRKQGAKKVGKKVVTGRQGTNAIQLSKLMRSGRYRVSVVATDAAGNVSKALRLTVRR
jgi:plastocyanin